MKFLTKKSKKVYLDYASLTPIDGRVAREVAHISSADYANPSAIHRAGVEAKKVLESSRASAAAFLHAHADEIFFTASGTEANNIAIRGVVAALSGSIHILVSAIEHASVLETVRSLGSVGSADVSVQVDYIPVLPNGIIDLDAMKKMLKPETALVSVMMANNEIGTIQPIRDAAKIIRDFNKDFKKDLNKSPAVSKILFHTDACQAPLYMQIDLEKLGVDLLTLDSNKVYGPRGVGVLYKKRSVEIGRDIVPIMFGGGQEQGLRPGTENVPAIAGFAKALEIAAHELRERSGGKRSESESESERLLALRDYFIEKLKMRVPGIVCNGSYAPGERLPNNINVTFPGDNFDHEFFLLELDVRGISCSTKSACLHDEDESYVIRALHGKNASKPIDTPAQSIRFSLGRFTSKKDIDYALKMIDEILSLHI